MEKRFLLFLTLSMLVMAGYLMLQSALTPPPQAADGGDPPPAAQQPEQPPGEDAAPSDSVSAEAPAEQPAEPPADAPPAEPRRSPPAQVWRTLQAPGSPLRVRLTNQGAGVERVELVGRQPNGRLTYRALDDDRPYLGSLVLEDAALEGVLVRYVAPGSPAAQAGLRSGDLIVSLSASGRADATILNEADFQRRLSREFKRLKSLTLGVYPGGDRSRPVQSLTVAATERPFALIRQDRDEQGRLVPTPLSFRLELTQLGERDIRRQDPLTAPLWALADGRWDVPGVTDAESAAETEQNDAITFSYRLTAEELQPLGVPGPLTILKTFRLAPDGEGDKPSYHLEMEVGFVNDGGEPIDLAYALYGSSGLSTEGWWYQNKLHTAMFSAAGARDIVVLDQYNTYQILGARELHTQAKRTAESPEKVLFAEDEDVKNRLVSALAGDVQYFSVAIIPPNFAEEGRQTLEFARAEAMAVGSIIEDRNRIKLQNNTFRVVSPTRTIPASEKATDAYAVFCGPKQAEVLSRYDLDHLIYQGWFAAFSQLAAMLLHGFHAVVRNYGLAIILLTVLVRGAMYPLGRKAAMNAKKMQELAPQVKLINDKYKNDMQKRSEEVAKLYKQNNFNPMSGCGVMFLQLPVFLGLYRCLAVDINLRQAALIPGLEWCSNLAGPDQLWNWSDYLPDFLAGEGAGYLGPYLNVLPIVTIALFLVQQKLFTPPPTDEQSRMQQQIMKYMMVFFCVMFFRVPAGLCIYFIASSLWGIAERKLLPNTTTTPGGDGKPTKEELETRQAIEAKRARKKRRAKG